MYAEYSIEYLSPSKYHTEFINLVPGPADRAAPPAARRSPRSPRQTDAGPAGAAPAGRSAVRVVLIYEIGYAHHRIKPGLLIW